MERGRDNFKAGVKLLLAARVGNRCSNPQCRALTIGPGADPASSVNLGEAAHISAAASHGPRFDATMSSEQRSSIANGIWLCPTCHKMVDSDTGIGADALRGWREQSERATLREIQTAVLRGGHDGRYEPAIVGAWASKRRCQSYRTQVHVASSLVPLSRISITKVFAVPGPVCVVVFFGHMRGLIRHLNDFSIDLIDALRQLFKRNGVLSFLAIRAHAALADFDNLIRNESVADAGRANIFLRRRRGVGECHRSFALFGFAPKPGGSF